MKTKTFNVYFNNEKGIFISETEPENLFELEMDDACAYRQFQLDDFYEDCFCGEIPSEITNFIDSNEIKLIVCEYVETFSPHRNMNYLTQIVTIYYK